MAPPVDTTVRVQSSTRDKLGELVTLVRTRGWSACGADRGDPPSQAAVVDEALSQMLDRIKMPVSAIRRSRR